MVTLTNKKRKMITRNELPKSFSWTARLKSFRYAFEGLTGFFAAEHNAIIHLLITISVFIGAAFFDLSKGQWIAIVLVIGFVWVAELFNTAIERLSDLISKDFHPGIKFIKDVSAAAVLVAAVVAFLTGAIIFIPKILM
jgi:diacylglycerol kinase (ATP)